MWKHFHNLQDVRHLRCWSLGGLIATQVPYLRSYATQCGGSESMIRFLKIYTKLFLNCKHNLKNNGYVKNKPTQIRQGAVEDAE